MDFEKISGQSGRVYPNKSEPLENSSTTLGHRFSEMRSHLSKGISALFERVQKQPTLSQGIEYLSRRFGRGAPIKEQNVQQKTEHLFQEKVAPPPLPPKPDSMKRAPPPLPPKPKAAPPSIKLVETYITPAMAHALKKQEQRTGLASFLENLATLSQNPTEKEIQAFKENPQNKQYLTPGSEEHALIKCLIFQDVVDFGTQHQAVLSLVSSLSPSISQWLELGERKDLSLKWSIQGKVEDLKETLRAEAEYEGGWAHQQVSELEETFKDFFNQIGPPLGIEKERMTVLQEQLHKYATDTYKGGMGVNAKMMCEDLKQGKPVMIASGWKGHSTGLMFYPKDGQVFLVKCNRGERQFEQTDEQHQVQFFLVDPSKLNLDDDKSVATLLKHIKEGDKTYFGSKGINQELNLRRMDTLKMKDQKTGNCAWASAKSTLYALMVMERATMDAPKGSLFIDKQFALDDVKNAYKEFTAYSRYRSLEKYLENTPKDKRDMNLLEAVNTEVLSKLGSRFLNNSQRGHFVAAKELLEKECGWELSNKERGEKIVHFQKELERVMKGAEWLINTRVPEKARPAHHLEIRKIRRKIDRLFAGADSKSLENVNKLIEFKENEPLTLANLEYKLKKCNI